ncbi:MAG: Crp/Fnr family transcriptional regulator [Betaproteobacteria bacterium RIFCSPLOWO2_12_FULL_68_20]|nr:MAG: Crp/Fnr family transcriptional regulator [Betaproteobacteria bacterium RIFCSPLOWO2_12_FULL_68_20]
MQACLWARALSPAEFQRVLAGVVVRGFPAGSIVCGRGEPVNAWIGVVEGLVKLTTVSLSGKETTLMGVPAGGWFGEGSLLKRERRKHDVVALRESRVAFMRGTTFRWLIEHSLAFNRFLTMQLNERLGQFIGMVEYDRLLAADGRVARCLAGLFNPVLYPGNGARLGISQEEIGLLSGLSRQRVNRALRHLAADGLVRQEYGAVTVLELEGLKRFET